VKHARVLLALGFVALAALVARATVPAGAARGDLHELAWIAGHWSNDVEGMTMEEAWIAPSGGIMLGVHRDVRTESKKLASWEYLRIEEREDGIVYVASPGGGPSTDFRLSDLEENRAVFENPAHDFPKRILYTRDGDKLTARIEGDEGQGMEWVWKLKP